MPDIVISETGFISMLAMTFAFGLACCRSIQTSRCTTIKTPCISCDRDTIDDKTLLELKKMEENNNDEVVASPYDVRSEVKLDQSNHRINPITTNNL